MQKSRLEIVKEQAKEKLSEIIYTQLESAFTRNDIPEDMEIKMWISAMESYTGKKHVVNSPGMQIKYENFLLTLEDDIQKRGKEAILEVLDNRHEFEIDYGDPRIKKILKDHEDLLKEIKSEIKEFACWCVYKIYFENEWRRKHKNLLKKEKRRIKISSIYRDLINKKKWEEIIKRD